MYDWQVLDLADDPAPGGPTRIEELAAQLRRVGELDDQACSQLPFGGQGDRRGLLNQALVKPFGIPEVPANARVPTPSAAADDPGGAGAKEARRRLRAWFGGGE